MQLAASPQAAARWPLAVAFLPPDEAFQEVPAVLSPPAEAFPAPAVAYQVQTAAYQEAAAVLSPPAEVFQARAVPLLPPVPPAHTAALQAAPAAVTPPAVQAVLPAATAEAADLRVTAAHPAATAVLQEVPPAVVIPPAVLQAAVTAAVRIHHIHRTLPVVRVLQAGIPEAVAEDINT